MIKILIKRRQYIYAAVLSVIVILFLILTGCDNGTVPPGGNLVFDVVFSDGEVEVSGDEVFDFGLTEAGGGSKTVTLIVTNNGESGLTVTALSVSDDTNYSLETPGLPGEIAAGQTGQYSLLFEPEESGALTADVSVTVDGLADPVTVSVTGEGNFAPVPRFGITVSGAEISGANGFYVRDGMKAGAFNTRPNYIKNGSPVYYSYVYDSGDGDIWSIADVDNAAYGGNDPLYIDNAYDTSRLAPPLSGWVDMSYTGSALSVAVHDISGPNTTYGETLTADYLYFDAEDDPEAAGTAAYQWYRSDSGDPNGSYTAISGQTSSTYTTTVSDVGRHIKVGITLTAESGFTAGSEVLSSPTAQIDPAPG